MYTFFNFSTSKTLKTQFSTTTQQLTIFQCSTSKMRGKIENGKLRIDG